jgi:hypothetical protein
MVALGVIEESLNPFDQRKPFGAPRLTEYRKAVVSWQCVERRSDGLQGTTLNRK